MAHRDFGPHPKKWWAQSDEFSIFGGGTLAPMEVGPAWENSGYAIVGILS